MKRNFMKFTNGKCKVLHLGWENIMQPCSPGTDWVEGRFAEEDLTAKKLNGSQNFTHVVKAKHTLCCVGWSRQQAVGRDPSTQCF